MKTVAYQNWSDEQLVLYIQESGDYHPFTIIYQRYYKRILYASMNIVKDADQAQDIAQDVMLKAMENLPKLQNGHLLGLWLNRIAKNLSIDSCKKQNASFLQELPSNRDFVDEVYDINYFLEKERKFENINKVMELISEEDRALLSQKYLYSQSIKDIQNGTLSSGAVKMRLNRAKKRVLKLYEIEAKGIA